MAVGRPRGLPPPPPLFASSPERVRLFPLRSARRVSRLFLPLSADWTPRVAGRPWLVGKCGRGKAQLRVRGLAAGVGEAERMIHSAVNASPGGGAGLGPMGRLYGARHLLFVKNLSPLVTEEHLRIIFENCSPVLRVEFKTLPGGGRYSEIEFKDSAGITAASQLNGTELMGLSMQISVLDPGGAAASASPGGGGVVGALTENLMRLAPPPPGLSAANSPALLAPPSLALPSLAPAAAGSAAGLGGLPQLIAAAQSQPGLAATPVSAVEIAMQNHLANLQAVQAAAQQAKQLAARKKSELGLGVAVTPVDGKLPPAQSLVSGVLNGEPELEQLAKTCFVHGFAQEVGAASKRSSRQLLCFLRFAPNSLRVTPPAC